MMREIYNEALSIIFLIAVIGLLVNELVMGG